ncbi:MAG: hypothetical protein ACFE0K_12560 [Alcanivorax sp.]|uniref:hypothetical protein n=1 Tax=Alcanivorax sp. TaxID=1872427 RepID=UPI003DA7A5EC
MRVTTLIASLLISSQALAHTPVCRCELTGNDITCTGQFHDGSEASGVAMTVFDYHNATLASGQLNKQSRFQFTQPQQPFYIIMDAGPGEMFEVDWKDVKGLAPSTYP